MSIASRITSIEGHIEDDYNALTRLGADLTNVDKNIENIASVVNDIYDKLPKVTGTGSDLSLTPTLKGGLNIVPIGNAEQDTYTGKNLAQVDGTNITLNSTLVASKVNQAINLNGSTSISGTFYKAFEVNGNNSANYGAYVIPSNIINLVAGNYTLSIANKTGSYTNASSILFLLMKKNASTPHTVIGQLEVINETSKTVTIANDGEYYLCIQITGVASSNVTFTNYSFNLMLEKSSQATSWEPYVGGIPSPNPDYPQDVKVVTGDNNVVVQNKNFLPFTNQDFTIASVRFYVENGTLKLNGTASGNIYNNNSNFKTYFKFTLPAGTYYYFTQSIEKGQAYIKNYATDTTLAQNAGTFTLTEETKLYYSLYITNGTSLENVNYLAQLEKGTTYSEIIPHQEQSTTLHLGSLELCKIGDYQDVITGSKDNWKVVRNVGKVDLSTLTFNNYNLSDDYKFYYTQEITDIKYTSVNTELGNGLAEKYILHTGSGMISNSARNCLAIDTSQISLNTIDSPSGLFYYVLATPTEETITDTSLVQSLNELNDLMSYDGTTNITITSASSNAQMLAQVSALKGE